MEVESEGGRSDRKKATRAPTTATLSAAGSVLEDPNRIKHTTGVVSGGNGARLQILQCENKKADRIFLSFSVLFFKRSGEAEEGNTFKRRETRQGKKENNSVTKWEYLRNHIAGCWRTTAKVGKIAGTVQKKGEIKKG